MLVYKLFNTENDKLYIGSTKSRLNQRLSQHRCACKEGKSQLYQAMKELGAEKFNIELLVECEDMLKREQMFIEAFQTISKGYNQVNAYLTQEDRKRKAKAYNNVTLNCDLCGSHYLRKHKARHERTQKHLKSSQEKVEKCPSELA